MMQKDWRCKRCREARMRRITPRSQTAILKRPGGNSTASCWPVRAIARTEKRALSTISATAPKMASGKWFFISRSKKSRQSAEVLNQQRNVGELAEIDISLWWFSVADHHIKTRKRRDGCGPDLIKFAAVSDENALR